MSVILCDIYENLICNFRSLLGRKYTNNGHYCQYITLLTFLLPISMKDGTLASMEDKRKEAEIKLTAQVSSAG